MTEDEAKWCPIPGWVGLYEASDDGRIRSVDRLKPYGSEFRRSPGKVLSPATVKGYPRVNLWRGGKQHPRLVHVLVARTHLPPAPTPKHQLNHRNGNRADAAAANLEWVTASENLKHSFRELGRIPAGGKSFGRANGRFKDGARCGLAGAPQ